MTERVWLNGVECDGTVPVTDSAVLRGDGCFEVLRSYSGTVFAIEDHLDRLERSAGQLEIVLPPRSDIAAWIETAASQEPDGAIRVVVTRGSALPDAEPDTRVFVFSHLWRRAVEEARLLPVRAPWHSAGEEWELRGAKVLSYAPNMAASRVARRAGFDDALLTSTGEYILEGPTFTIAWVFGGIIETPSLDLGILASITRKHVLELARLEGIEVREGVWRLDRLSGAEEVMALSTIRQVQPVVSVGEWEYSSGPITRTLEESFSQLVGLPLSTQGI